MYTVNIFNEYLSIFELMYIMLESKLAPCHRGKCDTGGAS
jgi:hypothetical protein